MKAGAPQTPSRAEVRAGLAAAFETAREARAPGPSADPEALRSAYLGLLKLCLCDLAASSTVSVDRTADGLVMSRELVGGWVKVRALGLDWPRQGLTMIGLDRLDDLQSCVESVVKDGVEGDLIEAGSWRGGASILMRAALDSLGADDRTLYVADSFEGFPAATEAGDLAVVDFLAVSLEEVQANFARFGCEHGVHFLPGFFEETIPSLSDRRWSIIRLDGDTYEATRLTLESLYPRLSVGGYLIVDDYRAFNECRAAVDEFRDEHGIGEPLERVDWTCVRWRRESEAPIVEASPARAHETGRPRGGARRVVRPGFVHVPSAQELELRRENAAQRERLGRVQAELDSLRGSPFRGPAAWLRRKLGRGLRSLSR